MCRTTSFVKEETKGSYWLCIKHTIYYVLQIVFYFPDVSTLLDLKVFIDAKDKVKLQRRIKRDNEERGYDLTDVMYRWQNHVTPTYEKYIRPYKKIADVVIPNNINFERGLEVLVTFLKSKIAWIS